MISVSGMSIVYIILFGGLSQQTSIKKMVRDDDPHEKIFFDLQLMFGGNSCDGNLWIGSSWYITQRPKFKYSYRKSLIKLDRIEL